MYPKPFVYLLLVTTIIFSLTIISANVNAFNVTQDFTNALDAAVQEMITETEWVNFYTSTMYFTVPTCTSATVKWPTNNPFSGRSALNMCFETGTLSPWLETKTKLAQLVVKKINSHYGTSYSTNILRYNTSALGFFDTMRNAVNSGECDMVTANTLVTTARTSLIHYQCPFGTASNGWIRTSRDPQLSLTDISQLNKTGIIVGAYEGTAFATYVRSNLQAATFVPYAAVNLQYTAVLEASVHAIIGDAIQYYNWANVQMAGNCNCTVKTYGNTFSLATFSTVNITTSGVQSLNSVGNLWTLLMIISMFFMF